MAEAVGMSAPAKVYRPRALKRFRRTKAELAAIRCAVREILRGDHPQSVRHVYYRAAGTLTIDKEETGYRVVQRTLLQMRRDGAIKYSWVSDGTRWRRQQDSFDTPAEAVKWAAECYRRDLWRRTPVYVEVWCESDSMAGVLYEETNRYNVPLMVSRGFASESYLYAAAEDIKAENRPAYIYYVGDWDDAGKLIPEIIEKRLRGFAPKAEIHFQRLLVNPDQIREWGLSTKPFKRKSTHARSWTGGTVEAEAVPAKVARRIVREAIEHHLNLREVTVLQVAERSERQWLADLAERMESRPWLPEARP
jgi:hypothetical protein